MPRGLLRICHTEQLGYTCLLRALPGREGNFAKASAETPSMSSNHSGSEDDKRNQWLAEVRRERELRMQGYRERALKLFPPICGRCGREFEGRRLRELTVHHKDHDHDNNPPDGSNWELLCLYCHDNEHQRLVEGASSRSSTARQSTTHGTHQPFADLKALLNKEK